MLSKWSICSFSSWKRDLTLNQQKVKYWCVVSFMEETYLKYRYNHCDTSRGLCIKWSWSHRLRVSLSIDIQKLCFRLYTLLVFEFGPQKTGSISAFHAIWSPADNANIGPGVKLLRSLLRPRCYSRPWLPLETDSVCLHSPEWKLFRAKNAFLFDCRL